MLLKEKLIDFTTFKFVAHTIDGKILEFPETFDFRCDLVIPLYQDIVKDVDEEGCIVARTVYMVSYDGHLFGTMNFTNMEDFVRYRNRACGTDDLPCNIIYNSCPVTYNDCQLIY
jgi:hypothetical protein